MTAGYHVPQGSRKPCELRLSGDDCLAVVLCTRKHLVVADPGVAARVRGSVIAIASVGWAAQEHHKFGSHSLNTSYWCAFPIAVRSARAELCAREKCLRQWGSVQ